MESDTHLDWIRVPPTWAGFTRVTEDGDQVWACVACPDVNVCAASGACQRATPEDFKLAAGGRV